MSVAAMFLAVAWFEVPEDPATWWLSLSGIVASVGIVLLASTTIAASLARSSHQTQVLDDLSAEICSAGESLMACGRARLSKGVASVDVATIEAASKLTKKVGLLVGCIDSSHARVVGSSTLTMKKMFTDGAVTADGIERAERAEAALMRALLKMRMAS